MSSRGWRSSHTGNTLATKAYARSIHFHWARVGPMIG